MGDAYIDVHGASLHGSPMQRGHGRQYIDYGHGANGYLQAQEEKRYNQTNPGLGLRYEWGNPDLTKILMGGGYVNSYSRPTFYAGGGVKTRLLGGDSLHLDGGLLGGLATGYNDSVVPMAMPTLHLGGRNSGLNLMYAPAYNDSPATYMLSGQWRLK